MRCAPASARLAAACLDIFVRRSLSLRLPKTAPLLNQQQGTQHNRAQVRKLLRRQHGIDRGIPVVLSTERPRCKLVDMTGGGNLADFQACGMADAEARRSIV